MAASSVSNAVQLHQDQTPTELATTVWQNLIRATQDGRHPWRYPVLATVHQGLPRQRTVVVRRAGLPTRELVAYTDVRSQKVSDLQEIPHASWLFYHPKHRVQVTCAASIAVHHEDAVAHAAWQSLSPHQQRDYNTILGPGAKLTSEDAWAPKNEWNAERFAVLVATVRRMELVVLEREGPWRMALTDESGRWEGERLVP